MVCLLQVHVQTIVFVHLHAAHFILLSEIEEEVVTSVKDLLRRNVDGIVQRSRTGPRNNSRQLIGAVSCERRIFSISSVHDQIQLLSEQSFSLVFGI